MFKKCAKRNKILFHFMAPFLAMAELKQALFLLIWLNENVRYYMSEDQSPQMNPPSPSEPPLLSSSSSPL